MFISWEDTMLERKQADPSYTFAAHVQRLGGAIEV